MQRPIPSRISCGHQHTRAFAWGLAAMGSLLSIGCGTDMPNVQSQASSSSSRTPAAVDPTEVAQEKPLHPYWSIGVRDPNAPNSVLDRWLMPNPPDPSRARSARDLMQAIAGDNVSILDVYDTPLTNELRSKLRPIRSVEWLRLSAGVEARDLEWIGAMARLRGLCMAHARLGGADFQHLKACHSLQWLDLSYADISSGVFKTLPPFPKLETVVLAGNSITDKHLQHLARLRLPSLNCLLLYYTSVTDLGVEHVCSEYDLSYLDLFRAEGVTSDSIEPISRMKKLRLLGIGGTGICPDFTENESVRRLKQLLPGCTVDYGS